MKWIILILLFFSSFVFAGNFDALTLNEIQSSKYLLDQNFNNYSLSSANQFDTNNWCVTINELKGTEPCIKATITFDKNSFYTYTEMKEVLKEIDTNKDKLDKDGNIIGKEKEIIKTYEPELKTIPIQVYYIDFNTQELQERIDGILDAKAINDGTKQRPPELPVVSDVDKIKALEARLSELENRAGILETLFDTLNNAVIALQEWACKIDSKQAWCK